MTIPAKKTSEPKLNYEELEKIFNLSVDLICIANADGYFVKVNPAFEKVLGYSSKELLAQKLLDFVHPDDREKTLAVLEDHITNNWAVINFENRYRSKNGEYKWISWTAHPTPENNRTYAVGRDITEQKENLIVLSKSEKHLKKIYDTVNDAIIIINADSNRIESVNPQAVSLFGYNKKELIGMFLKRLYQKHTKQTGNIFREILSGKQVVTKELVCKKKDNTPFVASFSFAPFIDGEETYILAIARDITEQKKYEERLLENEAIFNQFAENVNEVFWLRDADKILYVSPGYEASWGKSCQSLYDDQSSFLEAVHPEDRSLVLSAVGENLENTNEFLIEFRIIKTDGRIRWMSAKGFPIYDNDGKIYRYAGLALDITDRKNKERKVKADEEFISAIFNNIREGIISVNLDGIIENINPAIENLFGYKKDELLYQSIKVLMTDPYRNESDQFIQKSIKKFKTKIIGERFEFEGRRKNGSVFPIEIICSELKLGYRIMYNAVIRDITADKELLRLRKEFEGFLRHELHNSLVPIKGFADILLGDPRWGIMVDPLTERQKKQVFGIKRGAAKIMNLISSLKKLHDFELGLYEFEMEKIDLKIIIKKVILECSIIAVRNNVELEFNNTSKESQIMMDATLLPGVFVNLVKNAIEHVENQKNRSQKNVRIDMFNKNDQVIVQINNKGKHIPKSRLKLFFEKFNTDRRNKSGGTGLGTTYAYLVTKAHQGDISVQSNKTDGTTVTVALITV